MFFSGKAFGGPTPRPVQISSPLQALLLPNPVLWLESAAGQMLWHTVKQAFPRLTGAPAPRLAGLRRRVPGPMTSQQTRAGALFAPIPVPPTLLECSKSHE